MRRLVALIPLALSFSPVARADYAVSCFCGGDNDVRLYYIDRGAIVRADCDPDSTIYDRATCNRAEARVPYAGWQELVDAYYGRDMDQLLRRRDETFVNLHRTEVKIDEYLARETPTLPTDGLEARLAATENLRLDRLREGQDLNDQIARIRKRLSQTPNPDLQAQLRDLVVALQQNRDRLAALDADCGSLRRQLIDAYATLGDVQDFQQLNQMWRSYGSLLLGIDNQLKDQMALAARVKTLEGHLFDQGFTWTQFNYSRGSGIDEGFAANTEGAFRQLEPDDH